MRWALPLAIASGLLYFACFPGTGIWPLAFVALCPLLVALRHRSVVHGVLLGLAAGTVTTFLGFFWLVETIRTHGGFPWPASLAVVLVLSLVQGGRFALFAGLTCAMSRRRWPWPLPVAGAFVTAEVAYPLLFPWFLGASLHRFPLLIQTADLGGPVLVGLPLALTSAAVADAFGTGRPRMPARSSLVVAALAIVLPVAYGALMIPVVDHSAHAAPTVRVGLVQGDVPMPPATAELLHRRFAKQVGLTRQLEEAGADLVLWPESAFIHVLPVSAPGEAVGRTEAGSMNVPLLTGALVETDGRLARVFNSALMIAPGGLVRGRYDKQHRLPFGEYLPLGDAFPVLYRWSPGSGRIAKGDQSGPVPFEDKRITVLICYEDILPSFVRGAVRRHRPHLLANLTNDGWFGQSDAAVMHFALSKFRAVEHRRYLVRATNTGVTAIVDPVGREQGTVPAFAEGSLVGTVRWMHGWTLYGLWGDVPWYLVAVASLVGCWLGWSGGWPRRGVGPRGQA
jgi:apolipoprotein N-acyltransferase